MAMMTGVVPPGRPYSGGMPATVVQATPWLGKLRDGAGVPDHPGW